MKRLDRIVSNASPLSRKDARTAIRRKRVAVDGEVCTQPSTAVADEAHVTLDGEPLDLRPVRGRRLLHLCFLLRRGLPVLDVSALEKPTPEPPGDHSWKHQVSPGAMGRPQGAGRSGGSRNPRPFANPFPVRDRQSPPVNAPVESCPAAKPPARASNRASAPWRQRPEAAAAKGLQVGPQTRTPGAPSSPPRAPSQRP